MLGGDREPVGLAEQPAELDSEGARAVWRLVRSLAAEGKGVLLATSDVDALPDVADRVVWLEQGRVRALGEASLLAEGAMCEAGLRAGGAGLGRAAGVGGPPPP